MNPRERIAGMARLYLSRGEPIPLTLLAEADELGLNLADFDQPKPQLPKKKENKRWQQQPKNHPL